MSQEIIGSVFTPPLCRLRSISNKLQLQFERFVISATVQSVSQVCDNHLMSQLIHGMNTTDVQIYDELRKVCKHPTQIFHRLSKQLRTKTTNFLPWVFRSLRHSPKQ